MRINGKRASAYTSDQIKDMLMMEEIIGIYGGPCVLSDAQKKELRKVLKFRASKGY